MGRWFFVVFWYIEYASSDRIVNNLKFRNI